MCMDIDLFLFASKAAETLSIVTERPTEVAVLLFFITICKLFQKLFSRSVRVTNCDGTTQTDPVITRNYWGFRYTVPAVAQREHISVVYLPANFQTSSGQQVYIWQDAV